MSDLTKTRVQSEFLVPMFSTLFEVCPRYLQKADPFSERNTIRQGRNFARIFLQIEQ